MLLLLPSACGAAPAAAAAEAKKEENVEEKEESDDDMRFRLFNRGCGMKAFSCVIFEYEFFCSGFLVLSS